MEIESVFRILVLLLSAFYDVHFTVDNTGWAMSRPSYRVLLW